MFGFVVLRGILLDADCGSVLWLGWAGTLSEWRLEPKRKRTNRFDCFRWLQGGLVRRFLLFVFDFGDLCCFIEWLRNESETRPMRIQVSTTTYCLVRVRELAPRLGNMSEDLAVGRVRVRGLDLFADVVLVEEIGRGRAFGRVGVPGFLFFRLPLAFFPVAVERAVVGSGGILILVGLLGAAGPAFHGGAIGDHGGMRCGLEGVLEGEG